MKSPTRSWPRPRRSSVLSASRAATRGQASNLDARAIGSPISQLIQHVSATSFMVAGFRAEETERPDALFPDPLAAKLAGDHGANILKTVPKSFAGAWSVIIRTIIIDDYIREAVAGGVDTVLNLGAGLDTPPYPLGSPKTPPRFYVRRS